ncbi:hypothetical protein T484DRAFT_1759643 [Baffinella frigidus]|nr:hypothetical protein T484DRAFT_1759643 [Cryptophyta sp. CCMP2293]
MADPDTAEERPHEASSTFNDPSTDDHFVTEVAFATTSAAASWATTESNASAVLSRAVSCSIADHTSLHVSIDDTRSVSLGAPIGAPRSRAVFVDRSILDSMTHLPRDQAAQMLGLCPTTFKKVCRRAGMKGWPYRRPLLGATFATLEGDENKTFSRGSSAPSSFQGTPHRTYSSPGRCLSAFSSSAQPPAPPPMILPPCCIQARAVSCPSFSAAASASSSSMPAADGSFFCRDAGSAQTPKESCVVEAVLDYLDTLSSGCAAAHDVAALHCCELEAVVESLDVDG